MNARKVLRFLIVIILLIAGAKIVAFVKAYEPPAAIQFADSESKEVVWPNAIGFEVLNNTTKELKINIGFSDFTSQSGDESLLAQDILLNYAPEIQRDLPASGGLSVTMSIKSSGTEKPGRYAGVITVSEPTSNIVIRKPLQLVIANPGQAEELLLTPAVSTLVIPAYRIWWPLPIFWKQKLWCWNSCYLPVEKKSGESISAEQIGYVSGEKSNVLRVSVDSYSEGKGAKLKIEYPDNKGPVGKYSGTIDFLPQDKNAGEVALTVNVTDIFVWPALVLIGGIWLAIWAQQYAGESRKIRVLKFRLEAVAQRFNKFCESSPAIRGYRIEASMKKKLDKLNPTITKLKEEWFEKIDEEKRYKDAVVELEDIEKQVDAWTKFREKIDALEASLGKVHYKTSTPPPSQALSSGSMTEPKIVTSANKLLKGKELTLDEFKKQQTAIENATRFAEEWDKLSELVSWSKTRLEGLSNVSDKMNDKQKELLNEAKGNLYSAWFDLWSVEDEEQLTAAGTRAELVMAKDTIWRLWHLLAMPPREHPPRVPMVSMTYGIVQGGDFKKYQAEIPQIHLLSGLRSHPDTLSESFSKAEDGVIDARRSLKRGDGAMAVIATVTAFLTGMTAIYFTKNFGTLGDYCGALVWGGATKAVLDGINVALRTISSPKTGVGK